MTGKRTFTIATRRSPLALWQANTVASLLRQAGHEAELNLVTTSGDKMQRGALAEVAIDDPSVPEHLKTGKGLFVKEVQEEILAGRADLAVHSMKDLPVETTEGLRTAAVLPRANPCDVMIFSPQMIAAMNTLITLPETLDTKSATILQALRKLNWEGSGPVGTTSARRQFFLRKALSPAQLPLVILRGNVDTRLARVANNEFSFIMLARAGLDRLGLTHPSVMLTLPADVSIPAPAQGVVAVECRTADSELRTVLARINDPQTAFAAASERLLLWLTGGNCHTAIAAHCRSGRLSSWAAKESQYCELNFDFSDDEVRYFQSLAQAADYHTVFGMLQKSSPAVRMHQALSNAGFEKVSQLRTPSLQTGSI